MVFGAEFGEDIHGNLPSAKPLPESRQNFLNLVGKAAGLASAASAASDLYLNAGETYSRFAARHLIPMSLTYATKQGSKAASSLYKLRRGVASIFPRQYTTQTRSPRTYRKPRYGMTLSQAHFWRGPRTHTYRSRYAYRRRRRFRKTFF